LFAGTLGTGGTEKHYYQLLSHLSREKFSIHVGILSLDQTGLKEAFEIQTNYSRYLTTDVKYFCMGYQYLRSALSLRSYMKKNKISVIYSCAFETNLITLFATLFTDIRVICGLRGVVQLSSSKIFFEKIFRLKSDYFIANSKKIIDIQQSVFLPKSFFKKHSVIYNGIESENTNAVLDEQIIKKTENKFVIGCITRLSPEKGVMHLIRAFDQIHLTHQNTILLIVGAGPEESILQTEVKKLNISGNVIFTGNIMNASVYNRLFDIFVIPSDAESFPNALLEAMSYGCACIASDVGGIPEIIKENENGLLFKAGSVNDLVKKINILMSSEFGDTLRKTISVNAKKTVVNSFSLTENIHNYESLFLNQ